MPRVHAEPPTVPPGQQALEETLREAFLPTKRLEHQSAKGLGQQSLEIPVIRRSGHDGPAREQKPLGDHRVNVRMPVRLAPEGLGRRHDPRHPVPTPERGPPASRDRLRGAARQDAQQRAVAQEEASKGSRHGEDRVAVRHRREDLPPELLREQLRALVLTRRAEVSRGARERDEELASAIGAAHPGESVLRAAAVQEALDDSLRHWPQRPVLVGEPLFMHTDELGEVLVDRPVETRALGMPGPVDGRGVAGAARPIAPPRPRPRPRREHTCGPRVFETHHPTTSRNAETCPSGGMALDLRT